MKKIVPIEKIVPNMLEIGITKFVERMNQAKSKGHIPVPNFFYETIQKNKRKKLIGKPKGISNSFHKIFILSQLLNERLSFEDLLVAMKKELGYRQPRGLRRHIGELLTKGLIKKVNHSFTLPEINLEYLKKAYQELVHNTLAEFEFHWLFMNQLPSEIVGEWNEVRAQELKNKIEKGDKRAWDFVLKVETDVLKGVICEIRDTKKIDSSFTKQKEQELEKMLKQQNVPRRIKYKLEILLDIYRFLSTRRVT
jgi:hypothetical protein